MIKLSVIIVLYNEYELAKKTLDSIYQNEIDGMEVILIDNTPDNKRYEVLTEKFPKIKYFHNKINSGFAGGVNFGLSKANGEYILILTPDMYILPQTIRKTIGYIEKNKDIGMVGSRLYCYPGKQERSANSSYPNLFTLLHYYNMPMYKLIHRFNQEYNSNHFSIKDHEKTLNTKWINGQYMLARRKALDDIGGFDERFFLYFEDVDLCKRLIESGWKVIYLPVGGVVQNGITKWKKTKITQALPPYMESLYNFFLKHYGRSYAIVSWFIGIASVVMSIPYLFIVMITKKILRKQSQSQELLPLWIDIARWHLTRGIKLVF
ncbi:MAG: glycosyltransferase [Patescibacteria group bacterium]